MNSGLKNSNEIDPTALIDLISAKSRDILVECNEIDSSTLRRRNLVSRACALRNIETNLSFLKKQGFLWKVDIRD